MEKSFAMKMSHKVSVACPCPVCAPSPQPIPRHYPITISISHVQLVPHLYSKCPVRIPPVRILPMIDHNTTSSAYVQSVHHLTSNIGCPYRISYLTPIHSKSRSPILEEWLGFFYNLNFDLYVLPLTKGHRSNVTTDMGCPYLLSYIKTTHYNSVSLILEKLWGFCLII